MVSCGQFWGLTVNSRELKTPGPAGIRVAKCRANNEVGVGYEVAKIEEMKKERMNGKRNVKETNNQVTNASSKVMDANSNCVAVASVDTGAIRAPASTLTITNVSCKIRNDCGLYFVPIPPIYFFLE